MNPLITEFKVIVKYSKYVIPTLSILSICKMSFFYLLFNVNFSYYIGLDEVLAPFINDILFYVLTFWVPVIIMSMLMSDSSQQIALYNLKEFEKQKLMDSRERFMYSLKKEWFISLIYSIILIFNAYEFYNGKSLEFVISSISILPFVRIIFWLRKEFIIKINFIVSEENVGLLNLSTSLIVILISMLINTATEVYNIKNKNLHKVSLYINDNYLNCNDSISYIGKTKNYIFLYNKNKQSTTILNASDVKKTIIYK